MSQERKQMSLSDIFNIFNILKFVGTFLIASIAVCLNSTYVSHSDLKIVDEKVQVISSKVLNIENKMFVYDKQYIDIAIAIKSIDRRLGNLITEDGKILYDYRFINMEKDISLIQKDIQYIKEQKDKK
jgi:hypothetical protein